MILKRLNLKINYNIKFPHFYLTVVLYFEPPLPDGRGLVIWFDFLTIWRDTYKNSAILKKTMTKKFTVSDEDKRLFAEAIKGIKPLQSKKPISKNVATTKDTQSLAYRRYRADQIAASTEPLGTVQAETALSFCRTTVSLKKWQSLTQGLLKPRLSLDLHGLNEDEAIVRLNDFIYAAHQKKISVVLIVHGKGQRNTATVPILKNAVNVQLRALENVLAFCSARPEDGGNGAVYVLLK